MMGSYDSSHSKFSFSFKTQNGSILIHDQNTKHHSKFLAIKYGISFALQDKQSFKVFYFNDICILLPRNTAVHIGCICSWPFSNEMLKSLPFFFFFGSFQIALGYCTKSRTSPTTDMVTETQSY